MKKNANETLANFSKKNKKTDAQSGAYSHVRRSFTYTSVSVKRKLPIPQKNDTDRVMTPIEAEKKKASLAGTEPNVNMSTRYARQFLHAKRTLILKPAPKPVNATEGHLKTTFENVKSTVFRQIGKLDYFLIAVIAALSLVGIFAVNSATKSFGTAQYLNVQVGVTIFGIVLMFVISFIDYDTILKKWKVIFLINIALLLVTAIFGTGTVGSETNRNWLRLGPISFQPAELAKIMFILTFAVHLDKVRDRINSFYAFLGLLLHGGIVIGLILLERDLGQAIVFFVIFLSMLFAAKLRVWYFLAGGAIFVAGMPFLWTHLNDYQKKRILVGFNPESDPLDKGWQVIKSKTAVASGGIAGSGYMQGAISQSDVLPAKHTDMIFSVVAEEFGLIGAVALIALLCVLIFRILKISASSYEMSGYYICVGICAMLIFQTVENIGMCLGFFPVIGITLPFVSAGGSSLLNLFFTMGIVLSVYTKRDTLYFG